MHNIYDCVDSFSSLLNTEYYLVLGRKGISVSLHILFDKRDCFHLMGLQYLTDRPELKRDRGKIFDDIKNRKISREQIESSDLYYKIEDRVHRLPLLEQILDSNDTIFKYNEKKNAYSLIRAEYLIKSNINKENIYVFLAKDKEEHYFCRSFFPETNYDYTKNQASWTLLYKEKINHVRNEHLILYNRLKVEG